MTTTPTERATTLTERVAEEIRALMGRRRVSGAALARSLGRSEAWISYRLSGKQTIDLHDLEAIAAALGVAPVELLPVGDRRPGQPTLPNVERPDRPPTKTVDHGPKGRPGGVSGYRRSRQKRALTAEERSILVGAGSFHE